MLNAVVQKVATSERPMTLTFARKAAQQRLAMQQQQHMAQQQLQLQQQQLELHAQRSASARSGAEEKAATLAFVEDFRAIKKQLACVAVDCTVVLSPGGPAEVCSQCSTPVDHTPPSLSRALSHTLTPAPP